MEEVVGGCGGDSACPPLPTSPQDNASKLLLALMESRHDSENAERILISLRPQELVRRGPGVRWEGVPGVGGVSGDGDRAVPTARQTAFKQALPCQVDVIKKAYLQEEERENSEVSPREVGHNIYILALQVPAPPLAPPRRSRPHPWPRPRRSRPPHRPRPVTLPRPLTQLSRHNKQLQHLLKPVKRIQEEEAEGISSMVRARGRGWVWGGAYV